MARLYEYKDSSDKDGYFLWDGSEEGNATFQVTPLGERLLDRLNYDPGIPHEEQGPRLPPQLQWAMYEIELIGTGGETSSGAGFDGEFKVEDAEITEEMLDEIEAFVHDSGSDRKEVQELADILDIDPEEGSRDAFWRLTGSELEIAVMVLKNHLDGSLGSDSDSDVYEVESVTYDDLHTDDTNTSLFVICTSRKNGTEKHRHNLYFTAENKFEGILSSTDEQITWKDRVQIDMHRAEIEGAVRDTAEKCNIYIGDPADGPDYFTVDEVDSATIHKTERE